MVSNQQCEYGPNRENKRRQRRSDGHSLIRDYEPLSPVTHVAEPSDRGPVFERLLDHLDPVFDGDLPPNAYVHGPYGSGKSATVTALFTRLEQLSIETRSAIHTSTRAVSTTFPGFVYVDLRKVSTVFSFYRTVLDAFIEELIPEHGIRTAEIPDRLRSRLETSRGGIVVAIDHTSELDSTDIDELGSLLTELPDNLSWIAIGRADPERLAFVERTKTSLRIERYRRQTLVDIMMTRLSMGAIPQALDYKLARVIAEWADGNAYNALTVPFIAADQADQNGQTRITERDVTDAINEMPQLSTSLGRLLALPANKQRVLRELVDVDASDRASVTERRAFRLRDHLILVTSSGPALEFDRERDADIGSFDVLDTLLVGFFAWFDWSVAES